MPSDDHYCQPVTDPETGEVIGSVRMAGNASPETRQALVALIGAARTRFAAEHPEQNRPELTEEEWEQLATDVVDHYTSQIGDSMVRAYLREHRRDIPLIAARRVTRLIRDGQPITLGARPSPTPEPEA